MTTRIRRRGRPPEIPDRVTLAVYLTAQERRRLARAARQQQMSTSAWVRAIALTALDGTVKDHAR
jgi:hypothetical protein